MAEKKKRVERSQQAADESNSFAAKQQAGGLVAERQGGHPTSEQGRRAVTAFCCHRLDERRTHAGGLNLSVAAEAAVQKP